MSKKEISKIEQVLTTKELAFVKLYIDDVPLIDAYNQVGLGNPDKADAMSEAKSLLSSPLVNRYIALLKRESRDGSVVSLKDIQRRLVAMIDVDIIDMIENGEEYVNEKGETIRPIFLKDLAELSRSQRASIESVIPAGAGGHKIQLIDKLKAIDMLIKTVGGYLEKIDVKVDAPKVYANVGNNGRGPLRTKEDS